MIPGDLKLVGELRAKDLAEGVRLIGETAETLIPLRAKEWEKDDDKPVKAGGQGVKLEEIASKLGQARNVIARLGRLSAVLVWPGSEPGRWNFRVQLKLRENLLPGPLAQQRALIEMARRLHAMGNLCRGALERLQGGVSCVPKVPIAGYDRVLVTTTDTEVEAAYEHPDAFWKAGWTVEVADGLKLCIRHPDALDGAELLRAVRDAQWEMARAARPGLTEYSFPAVEPDERAIYEEGQERVLMVGYVPSQRLVEYSCLLGPGQHIHGWEIFALQDIVESRKLPEGDEVETVRVVFREESMARRERRPLLDVGVRVFFLTQDGMLQEMTG